MRKLILVRIYTYLHIRNTDNQKDEERKRKMEKKGHHTQLTT